jgi:hypothetical protein
VIPISNLFLDVYDGNTIASTKIYGADKKTFVNIGSGNVFCLKWTISDLQNDKLDHFNVVIKRYDPTLGVYYDIIDKNVGLVRDFCVKSDLLPSAPLQYLLSVYVVAYNKQGSIITSNTVNPYICKGSGTYVKVQSGNYKQPIMKRALAFAKVTESVDTTNSAEIIKTDDDLVLQDANEKTLFATTSMVDTIEAKVTDLHGYQLLDAEGNELFADVTKLLNSINDWEVIKEGYTKGPDNKTWHINDIKFEALVDSDGYIITDNTDEPIYVL